jgi:hypothetical protein
MALKDALDEVTGRSKSTRCRVCLLIDTLPEPDAAILAASSEQGSGVALKHISDALALEGHAGMYHAVKHHRYVCLRP